MSRCQDGLRRAPHRRRHRLGRRARRLVPRGLRQGVAELPAGGNVGRGPALHPLHVGFDRSAEGRLAHDRRLSRVRVDDARIRVRLSSRRGLLVHRRCRLGHRAQLHRLRAARQRRHDPDVRGRAELSRPVALLAGLRQAQRVDLLHRADRDPRADARGRGLCQEDQAQIAAPPRLGRRADQSRGMDVVLRAGRRGALPGRRYLVADRNRRHPDLANSWPGQMRTVFGDHKRFVETYFSTFPGLYFTGDGARRDEDGFYWITGRVDDVINVAGHRLGTAEIESALVAHPKVAEAAVVGYPHDIKGQGIYAYVTLRADETPSEPLRQELVQWVRKEISAIAAPDLLQWAPNLPKTRSGKIMRRILRKIAADEAKDLGDVSTLADPTVVDDLVSNRMNRGA